MPRRSPAPVLMTLVRELIQADLDTLYLTPGKAPPTLKRARAIHHRQAQLISEGRSLTEVAVLTGSTVPRLSLLSNDPTFSELIAFYADQNAEIEFDAHKEIQGTLVDVLQLAADEIHDRLSDDAGRSKIPLGELRKIAEFAADRTIAPPRATQQGSTLPPARIELNLGWTPPAAPEPKLIDATPAELDDFDYAGETHKDEP